jgi:hypothetical protein
MRRRACAMLLIALAILPFSAPFSTCALEDFAAVPHSDNSPAAETLTIALHRTRGAAVVGGDIERDRGAAVIASPVRVQADAVTRVWRCGPARSARPGPTSPCSTPLRI